MTDNRKTKRKSYLIPALIAVFVIIAVVLLAVWFGSSMKQSGSTGSQAGTDRTEAAGTIAAGSQTEAALTETSATGDLSDITARGGTIDWAMAQSINPDIFAWVYIPGTDIDYPVLQSDEADNYYETHDMYKAENESGALYTELANMKNMCDFNTVIHGKAPEDETMFSDLQLFADADFFNDHHELYLYLPDNVLTYEIIAAYPREDTSLIRQYDFTYIAGCDQFLKDMYGTREMTKNFREGWDELTPYNFLLTLTTHLDSDSGRQYVVVCALTNDAAGKINKVFYE